MTWRRVRLAWTRAYLYQAVDVMSTWSVTPPRTLSSAPFSSRQRIFCLSAFFRLLLLLEAPSPWTLLSIFFPFHHRLNEPIAHVYIFSMDPGHQKVLVVGHQGHYLMLLLLLSLQFFGLFAPFVFRTRLFVSVAQITRLFSLFFGPRLLSFAFTFVALIYKGN